MSDPHAPLPSSPTSLADLTGTTVGRFAVRARLGAGGMGEVYRAEDTKLKRPVALKRMAPHLRADEQYRRRFLKEAERASSLSDQRIAGLFDVLEEGGEIFLVMEYVEGETLRQRLGRPLGTEAFLGLAAQCAEALVAAHERGLIHRDLKPENIMLTPTGQVKILDFGVAKRLPHPDESASTETLEPGSTVGGLSGTPAYMAPETLLEKEADGRADIFSLGVVFYETLTGRHPFRAGSFLATSDRILRETPAPLGQLNPRVPAELERIVSKMLAKRPEERYATAADLLVDLRALERGLAYPGRLPARGLQLWTRWPRILRGWRGWAAAAAVAALLALGAVGLWRVWRPSPPAAERIRVAVLPFANRTADQRLDEFRLTLTQMLVLDLTGSPNIQVLPYERLLDITRGLEAQGKDISSPEAIQAVAQYSNAQFVVVPTMFAAGSTLRVQAEFREAQKRETLGSAKAERTLSGSAEDTFYSLSGELAENIQQYFKKVGRGEDYQPRPDASRPMTVASAFDFTEGRNAFARGSYAQALSSFQRVLQADPRFALAYARMSQIYGLLGYDEQARDLSEQAARLIRAQTPLTDAYFIQANAAERKFDYAAAEEKYAELLRLYPDDPEWQAGLAGLYEKQGQYQKAIARYQEVLLRDPGYLVAAQKLGLLYSRTGDLPQAISQAEKALSLYRALGNQEGEAGALVDLGEIFRLKGEYGQARESGQAALTLFRSLGNEFGVLRATKLLGDVRASQGELQEARRYYQRVLSASGEIRNNRLVALSLMNTGVTYLQEGDYSKATEYYQRGVETPALRERAQIMTNLAVIYINYGPDPKRGLQLAEEAQATFQRMGEKFWEAQDRTLLGLYYMNAGHYSRALEDLQASLALFRSVEAKAKVAQTTYNIGRCYFFQNQYESALGSLRSALALFEELQDRFGVANVQIHLGWTYSRLGESAQARALLEEGLQAAQKNGYGELLPDAYNALGELYWEAGERERARTSFQQGSGLWREPNVSEFSIEARSNLGLLEGERGNFARSLSHCRAALERARQLQRVHTLARAVINLSRVQLLRKEYASATQALDELSSLSDRDLGLEVRAQAFHLRGKALEALGRTEEATASYQGAEQAVRQLQQTLAVEHRESFAARRGIRGLLP